MKTVRLIPGLPLVALLLTGCTVGPHYQAPQTSTPPRFWEIKAVANGADLAVNESPTVDRWWQTFHDPELESLVSRAMKSNLDLRQAVSRVRQARIQRAIATAGLFPSIDIDGGYNRGRGSRNVVLPFGNAAPASSSGNASRSESRETAEGAPAPTPMPPAGGGAPAGPMSPLGEGGLPGVTTNLYQVGFDASWEIDLFGARRRMIEAADAAVSSAEDAREGAVVTLLGELAQTYLQLRAAQARRDLARRNVELATDTLKVVVAKAKTGFATDLEVARQRAELAALQSVQPAFETEVRLGMHGLATLLAEPVGALVGELEATAPLPELPTAVVVGLPSDLLRRRPDVRRAERELAGATARTGVATADLFPHFDLAAAFGLDSSQPGNLADWSSHYYSITPGFRWPILDWGAARGGVRLAEEMQREARIRYDAVVMQSLADVENALAKLHGEERAHQARVVAVTASREAFTIADQMYRHGLVDSLSVLEAQRSLVASQDALVQSDAALRIDLVTLYKALGGGWEG
ncbi:MAG TPA: efflux transporter outer membrane subunit [Candidatus Didemnitutus sp.]|nr:efflux transporter outer membrane subunit [Candidatus Didemnitutus sp.]